MKKNIDSEKNEKRILLQLIKKQILNNKVMLIVFFLMYFINFLNSTHFYVLQ